MLNMPFGGHYSCTQTCIYAFVPHKYMFLCSMFFTLSVTNMAIYSSTISFSNPCTSTGQHDFNLSFHIKTHTCLNITNYDQMTHMPSSLSIHSPHNKQAFTIIQCIQHGFEPMIDRDGGDSNGGSGDDSGGNGGDGRDENEGEFGPLLKFVDVMKEAEAKGVKLPSDMMETAKTTGIREMFLLRYLELQGSVWPLGFLMKNCSMLRNRMLADPSFLFKVGTEVAIDSCCATFAEVQKRGKHFWAEFELYAADVLVALVVDIALVSMLVPYARLGRPSVSKGLLGRIQHACASLPSSVFEAERPGCRFSLMQRIATYFYKGALYGSVGFGCGLIGQGIANMIMNAKRRIKKSEEDIPVPPLVQSAVLWGVFLAVSSNTRYQVVYALEGLVEASPVAKRLPLVAMLFTVCVRFSNNIYGGMQFVDWARLTGVQKAH